MIPSNETVQSSESKPARAKTSKRPPAAAKPDAPVEVAKSRDPNWVKVTHYLPVELADKLTVATVLRRGCDQSDIIAEALTKTLSSVTFYDRSSRPTKPNESHMTVGQIGEDVAA
jgi:hypothetical protein